MRTMYLWLPHAIWNSTLRVANLCSVNIHLQTSSLKHLLRWHHMITMRNASQRKPLAMEETTNKEQSILTTSQKTCPSIRPLHLGMLTLEPKKRVYSLKKYHPLSTNLTNFEFQFFLFVAGISPTTTRQEMARIMNRYKTKHPTKRKLKLPSMVHGPRLSRFRSWKKNGDRRPGDSCHDFWGDEWWMPSISEARWHCHASPVKKNVGNSCLLLKTRGGGGGEIYISLYLKNMEWVIFVFFL